MLTGQTPRDELVAVLTELAARSGTGAAPPADGVAAPDAAGGEPGTDAAAPTSAGSLPTHGAELRALRWAFLAVADALRQPTGVEPIQTVIALDDALTAADGLLDAVPALLERARSGPAVEAYLDRQRSRLAEVTAAVATTRGTLDELRVIESQLQDRLAEHERLHAEVNRLRRLELLVGALDELAGQREVIQRRLTDHTGRIGSLEDDLASDARDLLRLTRQQLAALAEPTRSALVEAAEAQATLAAEEEQLAAARTAAADAASRYAQLRAERDERLAELRAHTEADRSVAAALGGAGSPETGEDTGLTRLRGLLDEVAQRLDDTDRVLLAALDAGGARLAADRAVRPLNEGTPPR